MTLIGRCKTHPSKGHIGFALCLLLAMVACIQSPCPAAEGGTGAYWPGFRNYLTGIVPPRPGLYVRNDIVYYSASAPRVVLNALPVADVSVEAVVEIIEPYFVLPWKIFGANHAAVVTQSFVWADLSGRIIGTDLVPSDTRIDTGDTVISPLLLGWHEGNLHYNANLAIFIPTGDYDRTRVVNTSRNYWTIDPQFGITYFNPKTGWDLSGAIGYSFNTRNVETDYKSGEVLHFDFAVGRRFKNGLKPGVVGYAWLQTTPDTGSSAFFGSFESQVYGIGPAIQWQTGRASNLQFRYYHEFDARDHLEGDQYVLTFRMAL